MAKYDISHALALLRPGEEFVLYGYSYSGLEWRASTTKPTETELNNKVSELNNGEPMKLLREERSKRLTETDWMANSDVTMTDAWKTYRQALRDLPASSTPKLDSIDNLDMTSVTWPTKPS
tara:strand:+ start:2389 stop:2751 length:363 start_codon:yes stop_codon:yes gene_type:complete